MLEALVANTNAFDLRQSQGSYRLQLDQSSPRCSKPFLLPPQGGFLWLKAL